MADSLNAQEIQTRLSHLPEWSLNDNSIQKQYKFKNFVEAIAFVNKLVEPAESAGHHPDISISYNKVTIRLTTHDAGGITDADFELAKALEQL